MDPEQPAVGDLDPRLETDPGFLFSNTETLPMHSESAYVMSGQAGYTHGQESISYQHSFQHHSSSLQLQQPPQSLPLQPPQDVDFEDCDTMQQSSDQQQSADQSAFAITASGEFQCTASKCKTNPVFKRKCDLTCVPLPPPTHLPHLLAHLFHLFCSFLLTQSSLQEASKQPPPTT